MALSREEVEAAKDALMKILNIEDEPDDPNAPQLSKEFKDAWNKIMQKYGGNNFNDISEADLQKLLQDLYDGNLVLD